MSAHHHHEIQAIADLALAATAGQLLVPQRHYVDVLLDLRLVARTPIVKSTIDDRLDDLRFVSMIHVEEVRADLAAIVGIAQFDDPFDLTWAEEALACDCVTCAATVDAHEAAANA